MRTIFFIAISCCFLLPAKAQLTTPEVISSGGDSYVQPNGMMDITIGESIIETFSQNNIFLTQGFQQCDLIVAAIEENSNDVLMGIQVFPNPTINEINITTAIAAPIYIHLYNSNGELILSNNFTESTTIDFSLFAAGSYILKLETGNTNKTYKIQKVK